METKWFVVDKSSKTITPLAKATTLEEAWEKTLEKWELASIGINVELYTISTCGLCNLYFFHNCEGCPVLKITGKMRCIDTPYRKYVLSDITEEMRLQYAQEELDFLKMVKEKTYDNTKNQ